MYLSAPSAISPQLFPFYKNETLQSSLAKDCCPQAMPMQIHNQSTEPTESGDDPRVPNYPRRSVAPSAQSNALHGTIKKYPMEASYK